MHVHTKNPNRYIIHRMVVEEKVSSQYFHRTILSRFHQLQYVNTISLLCCSHHSWNSLASNHNLHIHTCRKIKHITDKTAEYLPAPTSSSEWTTSTTRPRSRLSGTGTVPTSTRSLGRNSLMLWYICCVVWYVAQYNMLSSVFLAALFFFRYLTYYTIFTQMYSIRWLIWAARTDTIALIHEFFIS